VAVQRDLDCGHPFLNQVMVQTHLHTLLTGIETGMRDVKIWKSLYDERLLSGQPDGFHYSAVRFDRVLPFVATTAFHVEFDLNGKRLQRLGRESETFEHVTLSVTAFGNETVAVFGWVGASDDPSAMLVDSFAGIADANKADALLQLLFVQSDNIFLRPSWWSELSPATRQRLAALSLTGTTLRQRKASDLSLEEGVLVPAATVELSSG
jgi:hypothetical protein